MVSSGAVAGLPPFPPVGEKGSSVSLSKMFIKPKLFTIQKKFATPNIYEDIQPAAMILKN